MLSSNAEHGTTRIMSLIKKKPEIIIPSDGEKRGIFFDLNTIFFFFEKLIF